MKITRLYTGPDGESHFEEMDVLLEKDGDRDRKSGIIEATGIYFTERPKDHNSGWHNAPRRQFVILLEGELEIEIGNGSIRHFGPGNILLAEDTSGRGHISRNVGSKTRKTLLVTLD